MQDTYIGDIGDYGKFGLLREVCTASMSLAVNWYRVVPTKATKQDDGKFISYLSAPQIYRDYDHALFDALHKIVIQEKDRRIERIEQESLFSAAYFSKPLDADREEWHIRALEQTQNADVVFLDPDNGLETYKMHQTDSASDKHVKWEELKDYYARGQSVILYHHRPQMITKEKCIESVLDFQKNYLLADCIKLLEFPKYTNRYYFMFLHNSSKTAFDQVCCSMVKQWGANAFCREIIIELDCLVEKNNK